eukprot:gene16199-22034_t
MKIQLMIQTQIIARGIRDALVIKSFENVQRHLFVPVELQEHAYDDNPLPIGYGQTISQPYIVALMTEAAMLKKTDNVLDIGTGCGYAAAILSNLAEHVTTMEIIPELANQAKETLQTLGYSNVEVFHSDGSIGCPDRSPFDAILVAATAPTIPKPLLSQLAINGRLIIPVYFPDNEKLLRITRTDNTSYQQEILELVRFVPLKGQEGFK